MSHGRSGWDETENEIKIKIRKKNEKILRTENDETNFWKLKERMTWDSKKELRTNCFIKFKLGIRILLLYLCDVLVESIRFYEGCAFILKGSRKDERYTESLENEKN